jgi:AmmeMemoRadiSam system radical SAM enzyme/AmmeMemoRadiSam system protein B/AmmeMemoRadiSam system protein A
MSTAHLGKWWHRDEAIGRIICDLCPRHCSMKEGDRGFCFVRKIEGDQMVLDTYGRSTGFCIDPIEKKPLHHFYPGTSVLSFGTAGCNLGCQFCQNWDISKSREVAKLSSIAEPELIAQAAKELGCKSVAFTYNDPVVWAEYAIDTAKACRAIGVQSVAVTAGYMCAEARREFYAHMDAANVDLKSFSEEFYRKITYSQLEPVLETLQYLQNETDVWFEITNLLIPNTNDSDDELKKMCDWILKSLGSNVPLHFSAFHPDFRMTDQPRTPHETLLKAHDIATQTGLRYVYVGNVHDVEHSSTYCRSCRSMLIERDWYQLGRYGLSGNLCGKCGAEQAGRFGDKPGDWGRKRQAVNLDSFRQSKIPSSGIRVTLPIMPTAEDVVNKTSELLSKRPPNTASELAMPSPVMSAPVKLPMLRFEDLTEEQKKAIHRSTQIVVIAATCGRGVSKEWLDLLGPLGDLHVMGMFTTLKRGKQLRGCCGFLGRPTTLKEAVYSSAQRTATEDGRMPAISTVEIPYLSMDVSLLASPIVLTVPAEKRIDCVEVGKHGLKITLGEQSGLLLPSVAVEQNWTAEEFLKGVCRKAGLPEDAWKRSEATLEIFEGLLIAGEIEAENLPSVLPLKMPPGNIQSLQRLKQIATQNMIAIAQGATPSYYALDAMDGTVNGIVLTLVDTSNSRPLAHWIKTSLRPGVALQSSLFELCKAAADVLSQARFQKVTDVELAITVLFDPVHHGALLYDQWEGNQLKTELNGCSLEGIRPDQRAIVTASGDFAAVSFDSTKSIQTLLSDAALAVRSRRNPVGVYSMSCISTASSLLASNASAALDLDDVRPPAVAEGFYPSNPESRRQLVAELKSNVPSVIKPKPALAIMTPHAGLRYSGQVAMNVWSSVQLPAKLLLIGPKHTAFGRDWAVSPSQAWELPGGEKWCIDLELAKRIVNRVDGMELDLAAHAREHGVEIQLPILEALSPKEARPSMVAIAMKNASLDEIMRAAEQLADALRESVDRPLLVISSDLNHYAPEAENRRKDRLAIDAILTGDPKRLIETCQQNTISMCGLVPAALIMQTLINLEEPFTVEEISYENSGKRADPQRVVGYAGIVFRPA